VREAAHLAERVSVLAAHMRAGGAPVGVGDLLAAHRALAAVDASSREQAFLALRASLCSSRAELALFADAFAAAFAVHDPRPDPFEALGEVGRAALPRLGVPAIGDEAPPLRDVPVPAAFSEQERLREKDFAEYTDAERASARRLLARLAARAPRRLSRRTRPTRDRPARQRPPPRSTTTPGPRAPSLPDPLAAAR